MTKKNPDKREQKRLEKIENGKQQRRYDATRYVKEGLSLRQAASKIVNESIRQYFMRVYEEYCNKAYPNDMMKRMMEEVIS